KILVAENCFLQTIAVVQTRAEALGLTVTTCKNISESELSDDVFALLVQYPAADGVVEDSQQLFAAAAAQGIMNIVATDLLALTVLEAPGLVGADVAVGSAQRFGVPVGFGGPSAAFFATRDEFRRLIPGRIVGASR